MHIGYIWNAVSSNPQIKNVSLDAQLADSLQYADRFHVRIAGALIVPGESRYITLFHRAAEKVTGLHLTPTGIEAARSMGVQRVIESIGNGISVAGVEKTFVYAELLRLIESHAFNVLFFLNRSRLGRRAALSIAVADTCTEHGVKLFDMESPPSSLDVVISHDEQLLGAVKSIGFERDVRKLVDDARRGVQRRAERGLFGVRPTWGYKATYDEFGTFIGYRMDEDVKLTMQIIAEMYLNGYGLVPIAAKLNELGRRPPSDDQWTFSKVRSILERLWSYAGYAEVNQRSRTGRPYSRFKAIWEPMLPEETVRKMLAERKQRDKLAKGISHTTKYSRVVICDVCGRTMIAHSRDRKPAKNPRVPGKKRILYACVDHGGLSIHKLDAAMNDFLADLDDDNFRAALLNRDTPDQSGITSRIDSLRKEVDRRKAGITKADDDYYMHGSLDEDRHRTIVSAAKAQIEKLLAEITALEEQLHNIEYEQQRGERLDAIRRTYLERFNDPDQRSANAWIRESFRIYVRDNKVKAIIYL